MPMLGGERTFLTQLRVSSRLDWASEPHLLDIVGEVCPAIQASDISVTADSVSEGTGKVVMPAAEYEVNNNLKHCVDLNKARLAPNALWNMLKRRGAKR